MFISNTYLDVLSIQAAMQTCRAVRLELTNGIENPETPDKCDGFDMTRRKLVDIIASPITVPHPSIKPGIDLVHDLLVCVSCRVSALNMCMDRSLNVKCYIICVQHSNLRYIQ